MSFILDALRKSDQQRQRGAAPTLLTAQAVAVEPRRPAYWVQGLFAAVLVGAGILIGWLRPWQPEPPAPAASTLATKPLETIPRQVAPAPPPALPELTRAPEQQPPVQKPAPVLPPAATSPGIDAPRDQPASPSPAAATQGAMTAAVAPRQAPVPQAEKPASTAKSEPAQEQKVMTLAELPASIRQDLPEMQVLLHQYSPRPKNRFVTINNQTLQEGESPAPGITLEQITPDGMILSYKGYRFRRGVQQ